jgi:hypothetical protein
MNACLFCSRKGPFTRPEHIIPEALGNDDLLLWNEVCDDCNCYFGTKIENFVLEKTPLAFWRTYLGIRKKKNKLPHVDLSQPRRQKERLPAIHHLHDNLVFTCHDDYSVSMDIEDDHIAQKIWSGKQGKSTFVFTPQVLFIMGRFFLKVGLELMCSTDPFLSRSDDFSRARHFARYGDFENLWPIFHFQSGNIENLKEQREDSQGIVEEVFCYSYRFFEVADKYTLFTLTVGIDTWIVCLNNPYPTPAICSAFPNEKLNLIWYSPDEIKQTEAQQDNQKNQ